MLISRRKMVACLNSKRIGTLGASMLASGLILQAACSEMNRHAYKDLLNSDGSSTMIVSTSLIALGMVLAICGCAAEIILNRGGTCTSRYLRANQDEKAPSIIGTYESNTLFKRDSSWSLVHAPIDVGYILSDNGYTLCIKAKNREWITVQNYQSDHKPSKKIFANTDFMESLVKYCYTLPTSTIEGPSLV